MSYNGRVSLTTNTAQRRVVTVPAMYATAVVLTLTLPLWLPVTVVVDVARGKFRCPLARLLAFGVCWAWLEVAGITMAASLWLSLQSRNQRAHYALQRWWAKHLLDALRVTCGISLDAGDADVFRPGPALLFVRHASLADSLVSAYVTTSLAQMRPRYVLKRELLLDPCLDIVGGRVPNYFLDRGSNDSGPELAAVQQLTTDLGPHDIGIIFPEGTRANPRKRDAALAKIAATNEQRAARLAGLRHLLPPRPSGARAMLDGAPDADVIIAWHVGFEGLDTFGGILANLSRRLPPIRFVARRVPRAEIPRDDRFVDWLDAQWLRMDNEVDSALRNNSTAASRRAHTRGT